MAVAKTAGQPGILDQFDEGMLAAHIGFRIHIARRAIRRAVRSSARPQPSALPSGAISLLELVAKNPGIGLHDLARILFLDPPKVTLLIRRLKEAGLVSRKASAEDARKAELRITQAGKERLESSRTFSALQEQRIAQGLSAAERTELARLLRKLQETLR